MPERRTRGNVPALSEDGKVISGLAAVYYDPQNADTEYVYEIADPRGSRGKTIKVKERVFRGAFDEALKSDDVVCAYNHEHNIGRRTAADPNGSTMTLSGDGAGLEYRTQAPQHHIGQMVTEAIRRGDIRGASFQFAPRDGGQVWRQDGEFLIRELRSLYVYDAGPVDQPAYKATTATLRNEDLREVRSLLGVSDTSETNTEPEIPPEIPYSVFSRSDHDRLETLCGLLGAECRSLSYGEVTRQLGRQLERSTGQYAWPDAVYDTFFVYSLGDPPVFYRQEYKINADETVEFVGDPIKVKPSVIYEPVSATPAAP